jgi:hypothetical protein
MRNRNLNSYVLLYKFNFNLPKACDDKATDFFALFWIYLYLFTCFLFRFFHCLEGGSLIYLLLCFVLNLLPVFVSLSSTSFLFLAWGNLFCCLLYFEFLFVFLIFVFLLCFCSCLVRANLIFLFSLLFAKLFLVLFHLFRCRTQYSSLLSIPFSERWFEFKWQWTQPIVLLLNTDDGTEQCSLTKKAIWMLSTYSKWKDFYIQHHEQSCYRSIQSVIK